MLVLTRKAGQEIVIGGNVRLRVCRVRGNRVQLAIDAPAAIPIDRDEIHQLRQEFCSPDQRPKGTEETHSGAKSFG